MLVAPGRYPKFLLNYNLKTFTFLLCIYNIQQTNQMAQFMDQEKTIFKDALIQHNIPAFMHLKIFVNHNDAEFKQLYLNAAAQHNSKLLTNLPFFDAGFDIYLPYEFQFEPLYGNNIDFQIQCSATMVNNDSMISYHTGFYTYSRSSLSKSPIRLSNQQGIIDSGYRGNIIGKFDCMPNTTFIYPKFSRLLQICAPSMLPIFVEIVESFQDLGIETSRGSNGVGSTGV
jgi:dUTP pyrophosphatase